MKKSITDYNLDGKKVIIRVDFNVPIIDGVIKDDKRIIAALPTINYALEKNAKVILLSHLGRIKDEADKALNDLTIVALRLSELLFKPVKFVDETKGSKVEDVINNMQCKDVVLLQNTRYEDISNLESGCDLELSTYWASLGDIFIDDAFAVAHRCHASNYGIAKMLPNGIGFLMQKEVDTISSFMNSHENPFIIILGGAKVKDKIGLIDNMIPKVDKIIIGGGIAFTFMYAK